MTRILSDKHINEFKNYLHEEEKSPVTIEKYIRDIKALLQYAKEQILTKELVIEYKKLLTNKGYADASINSMLSSVNAFFQFQGWQELRVKGIRVQKQIYCAEEKELTKEEYQRLIRTAEEKPRLKMLLQTICSTGIRVSELVYFTVEAVKKGEIRVSCKNKNRIVLIPSRLRKELLGYAKRNGIKDGNIFRTKNGNPLNRSNIWSEMKTLCEKAKVKATKVYPHNLRKLFAKIFYRMDKDIAKLADILGHTSINTTRIYIMESGNEHRKKIDKMGLVMAEADG